jgi:hypothetical protein
MNNDWEPIFRTWSKPPSETEQERCDNAERMIRDAIKADPFLSKKSMEIFTQGSYRHNTNVKQDSDVDICVRLMDTFNYQLPSEPPNTPEYFGITPSNYTQAEFKAAVELALVNKFGKSGVTRGNKAFDVHENSYRVNADVVACFEHRRYTGRFDALGNPEYYSGTQLNPDKGGSIINWPHQNYENGVSKNKSTNNRFKYIIRVLKRLRNDMQENKIAAANNIASFLIESLVWNVPKEGFASDEYVANVRYVLAHTCNETRTIEQCKEWREVNELKYLFNSAQQWTRQQANDFLNAAWNYIGFE